MLKEVKLLLLVSHFQRFPYKKAFLVCVARNLAMNAIHLFLIALTVVCLQHKQS